MELSLSEKLAACELMLRNVQYIINTKHTQAYMCIVARDLFFADALSPAQYLYLLRAITAHTGSTDKGGNHAVDYQTYLIKAAGIDFKYWIRSYQMVNFLRLQWIKFNVSKQNCIRILQKLIDLL